MGGAAWRRTIKPWPIGKQMRKIFDNRILGPELPPVARVKQLYIRKIMLKVESNVSQYRINEILHGIQQAYCSAPRYRSIVMYYDIDPL